MAQIIEKIVRSKYPPRNTRVLWLDTKNDLIKAFTPNGWTKVFANTAINTLRNAGYLFAGIATIDTNPETPDAKVFYIANGKGTYTNFGGIEVTEDEVVILKYDTTWHKVATGIASDEKFSELEIEKITINKVLELNNANVVAYDDTIPFNASYIPFEIAKGEVLFVEYSNHTIGNDIIIALGTDRIGSQYLINDIKSTKSNGSFVGVADGTTGYIRFFVGIQLLM